IPGKAKLMPTSSPNSCSEIQRGTASDSSRGIAAFPPPKARSPIFVQDQNSSSSVLIMVFPHPAPQPDIGWWMLSALLYERLRSVDDSRQIRYRRTKRNLEPSQALAAATMCLVSDDAEISTGVSIAQPGTASRWRREGDAVLHLR